MPFDKVDAFRAAMRTRWGVAGSDVSGRSRRRSLKPKGLGNPKLKADKLGYKRAVAIF